MCYGGVKLVYYSYLISFRPPPPKKSYKIFKVLILRDLFDYIAILLALLTKPEHFLPKAINRGLNIVFSADLWKCF